MVAPKTDSVIYKVEQLDVATRIGCGLARYRLNLRLTNSTGGRFDASRCQAFLSLVVHLHTVRVNSYGGQSPYSVEQFQCIRSKLI